MLNTLRGTAFLIFEFVLIKLLCSGWAVKNKKELQQEVIPEASDNVEMDKYDWVR